MTNRADAFDWPATETAYRALIERPLTGPADLERLLLERGELEARVDDHWARSHDRTCVDTSDEEARRTYRVFSEEILPRVRELRFELDRRVAASPHADALAPEAYGVHLRDLRAGVDLYRPENLELLARDQVLATRHAELIGAMEIDVDGERVTLAGARAKLESKDRGLRERAWIASTERRMSDAASFDELFDELVRLRDRIGRNAGLDGYTPWAFRDKRRFDYTPRDCEALHAAVEEHMVPLVGELWERRRVRLGLDTLRPWDLQVDTLGDATLEPFESTDELIERAAGAFDALDPELGELFARLRDGQSLDLETRPHKAPGGFQNSYPVSKSCFILMNASGTPFDVETLVHEAGHAFHTLLASEQPLYANRETCAEFSEVASMSMELLALPHLGTFYAPQELERVRRHQLELTAQLFTWIAMGDAFQHWVYRHPEATPDERARAWCDLDERYRPQLDWRGFEDARGREWHRVPHFFSHPYYYVEYAIAQLGALGVWQRSLVDERDALARYKTALRLGGSRTLPEQFAAAGIAFDLGPDAIARAADVLRRALREPLTRRTAPPGS